MIVRELTVLLGAYLLAGLMVGPAALLGRMSPAYALPHGRLFVYWSRLALAVVLAALVTRAL